MASDLPTGTVTILFTDIEGSTRLWEQQPAAMRAALGRHDSLLRTLIEAHGGHVIKTTGDGLYAIFARAPESVAATLACQQALAREAWTGLSRPLSVRMGLHTGEAEFRDGDYFGSTVNRAARLMSIASGGQTLLSSATTGLVRDQLPEGVALLDLGEHRLKDLARPEHVFQLTGPGLAADFPPLRSLSTLPNNLPVQLTSFIGREHQMAEVGHLLTTTHLLTLTGPGGTGKTRLALQVAADVVDSFPDGVWLAELAPLSDPALVPQMVASMLGMREQPGRPLIDSLGDYFRTKSALLILDNCEHLMEACAQLVTTLLRTCAKLKILATSRETLGVAGETTYRVPSLSCPTQSPVSVESFSHYEAVRLFVERAQAAQPHFALTAHNLSATAQICQRLDGIPLALELAAIRIRLFTVEQIAARLDDRFRLLTSGSRTALPRQQTLRALIDWSYDLLTEPERAALRQFSVFAGGWTFEAAEAVIGPGALDLLSSLVDKSLVSAGEHSPTGQTRYYLLETIHQYAHEKLVEAGENEQARARHVNVYLQFAETVALKLHGPEQVHELQRMESEHDNLRTALGWVIAQNESAAALRLSGALGWFWFVRGYFSEGRQWLQQALALSRRTTERAPMSADYRGWYVTALQGMGRLAEAQGDYATTQALNEESLAFFQESGDRPGIALSLHWLGAAAFGQGDYAATRGLHEKCLALYRELGDKGGIGLSLNWLGLVAAEQGDYPAARALHEESLALFRELGDKRNIAMTLDLLGMVTFGQSDYATARRFHEEGLALMQDLGDKKGIAECLPNLAAVAQATGQSQRATKLLGAVEALLERLGARLDPAERAGFDRVHAAARAQLDETTFNTEWAAGRAMTFEQVTKYVLEANKEGA